MYVFQTWIFRSEQPPRHKHIRQRFYKLVRARTCVNMFMYILCVCVSQRFTGRVCMCTVMCAGGEAVVVSRLASAASAAPLRPLDQREHTYKLVYSLIDVHYLITTVVLFVTLILQLYTTTITYHCLYIQIYHHSTKLIYLSFDCC